MLGSCGGGRWGPPEEEQKTKNGPLAGRETAVDEDAFHSTGPDLPVVEVDPEADALALEDADGLECVSPFQLYVACLYWSVMLIVGASGGPLEYGIFSPMEQGVFLVLVIITSLVWCAAAAAAAARLLSHHII